MCRTQKSKGGPPEEPPSPACTPPGYWMGACTRTNDRLSNMANPSPVPAKRTPAIASPDTQIVCCGRVGVDGADSTRVSVSPDASNASMNAVPVAVPVGDDVPPTGGRRGMLHAPLVTADLHPVGIAHGDR